MGRHCTQGLCNCGWAVSLEATHQGIHWRIQGPQISNTMINKIITKRFFHQSPLIQENTGVQKGGLSFDIAFTWVFILSRAADTMPDKSEVYTQHLTLIIAEVPPWMAVSMSKKVKVRKLSRSVVSHSLRPHGL